MIQTESEAIQELLEDARGYGAPLAIFRGPSIIHAEKTTGHVRAPLAARDADAFVGSMYCQLTSKRQRLYRAFDTWDITRERHGWAPVRQKRRHGIQGELRKGALAFPLGDGVWVSPRRPDSVSTYRPVSAVKEQWNRMDFVLIYELMPGASVFVGRVASQQGRKHRLPGGAIQFFVPRDQSALLLPRTYYDL